MAFKVNFLESYDLESLKAELRRIAALTGKNTVSSGDIRRLGRVHVGTIFQRFTTIAAANEAAGLTSNRVKEMTNPELLRMLIEVWKKTQEKFGRPPFQQDLEKYGLPFSAYTLKVRFGSWRKALLAADELADREGYGQAMAPNRRTSLPLRVRYLVLERDGHRCKICNRTSVPFEVDHIVPVCKGGGDEMENLQTLCWDCNRGKGGILP